MTSAPPKKSVQDFISAAEKSGGSNNFQRRNSPWTNARGDVQKAFTVKLSEEYLMKIKFLSESTNKSQQKIVREAISERVDEWLKEVGF